MAVPALNGRRFKLHFPAPSWCRVFFQFCTNQRHRVQCWCRVFFQCSIPILFQYWHCWPVAISWGPCIYEKCRSHFHRNWILGLLGGHWAAMCPWFHRAVPIKLIWPSIEHITLSTPPSPQSPSHPPPRPGTLPTIARHITQRLTPWLAIFASNFHLRSYACYAGHLLIFWLLHICMGLPRSQIASSEFYKFFLLPIIATLPSLTYILGL